MRILHLIDSGGLYGAERMLLALVEEQIRQGLEPIILSAGEPGIGEKPLEAEARRLRLPVMPWRMRPGLNLRAARRILEWAKQGNYALLHSHGYKFNILMGAYPSRRRAIPLLATLHGYVLAPFPSAMWAYEITDRLCLAAADAIVIVSETMRAHLPKYLRQRLHTIPNGIPEATPAPAVLSSAVDTFMRRNAVNLLGVGRLSPEKGFDRLIDTLHHHRNDLPQVGVVIFGEGRERAALEQTIREYSLNQRVMLAGYHPEVAAVMPHFDALVMPSRTEGMPITILEAQRAGLSIIASKVGGLPSMLANYHHSQVLDTGNTEHLADAIRYIALKSHPASQERASSRPGDAAFPSAKTMERRYAHLYNNVIQRFGTHAGAEQTG